MLNKNIPTEDRDFFTLVRAGLWQSVDAELSPTPDWQHIYQLSCDRDVQGIVADGLYIYKLHHPELHIPDDWGVKFSAASLLLIENNCAVNCVQAKVCNLLNHEGITYVVMKGQAVAQRYKNPNLRTPGDIDLFLDYDNYERAKQCLMSMADSIEGEHIHQKHFAFIVDDITVELHADDAYGIGAKKLFNKLLTETLNNGQLGSYECNGVMVNTAPATFDLIYSFLHCYQNYIAAYKISLKQFCDLAMLIHVNYKVLDLNNLNRNIKKFGFGRIWNLFISFLHIYLGLSENETLFAELKPDLRRSDYVWDKCRICCGNSGRGTLNKGNKYVIRNIIKWHYNHIAALKYLILDPIFAIKELFSLHKYYIRSAYSKIPHFRDNKNA